MLQALLWFVMGRARSMLVATGVGLVTTVGLLAVAIVERSLVWGIMAGFGVLFSLVGLQGARALRRMRDAPHLADAACPGCGAPPPIGDFWACLTCWRPFDVFAAGGHCPNCGTPLATVVCADCGQMRPYPQWRPGVTATTAAGTQSLPASTPVRATVRQRIVWGLLGAFLALALCGLPNAEDQPLGLIVWTAGGALLGAMGAGTMTRAFRSNQARRKLRGTWQLVEVDGRCIPDGTPGARLILNYGFYEERIGDKRDGQGACWCDPLAEPPAISLTPKTGADAGKPRPGIYRLDGNTLTVCVAQAGQRRPSAFVAEPDVQQVRCYRRGGKSRG